MSGIMDTLKGFLGDLPGHIMGIIDRIFPPEQRAQALANLKSFGLSNPKLAAFLLANFALTGLPLALFITFSISVFIVTLIVALVVALLAAVLFTVFMVGVALLFVLPTIFLTTMTAVFLFLWGVGGYYLMKWFSEGQSPAEVGKAIGDKLNNLAGGRLDFLMDGFRNKSMGDIPGSDMAQKANGAPKANGTSEKQKPQSDGKADEKASHGNDSDSGKATNSTKEESKQAHSAPKKLNKAGGDGSSQATHAAETAKGAAGGVASQ